MSEKINKDWKKVKEDILMQEDDNLDEAAGAEEAELSELNNAALEHPSYRALEEKLTLAEQQAHENWEKSVRALAELDNVRRRAERDVENAHRYGLEKFVSSLLPVLDSLEQALQLAEQHEDAGMKEGLELTLKLFLDVLAKQHVERFDPQGDVFDPQQHEAMSIQDAPGAAPNSVIAVFQKGYKLNERVIRPARVIVSKK